MDAEILSVANPQSEIIRSDEKTRFALFPSITGLQSSPMGPLYMPIALLLVSISVSVSDAWVSIREKWMRKRSVFSGVVIVYVAVVLFA